MVMIDAKAFRRMPFADGADAVLLAQHPLIVVSSEAISP